MAGRATVHLPEWTAVISCAADEVSTTQHAQDDGQRALQVQIPLVLSRRVQDLHQNCRRSHLQVDNTQAKRH